MGMRVLKAKPEKEIHRDKLYHTNISYWLVVLAISILFIIGIRNIADSPEWSTWAFVQGSMALIALVTLQIVGHRPIFQKHFKRIDGATGVRTVLIFFMISVVMTVVGGILTISEIEIAFYFVFASITEEMFFRALLLQPFRQMKTLGVKFIGVIFQAVLFTVFHVNYWGDTAQLISVFISGIVFGTAYVLWDDITANILAHFAWNIIQVGLVFIAW